MRVLQVLGRSAGGIAKHVAEVTARLDGEGGLVVDIAGPSDLPMTMPKPVIPLSIPDGPVKGHPSAIRALRRIVKKGGYRVVHAHGLRAAIDAALAVKTLRVPVVMTVHNLVREEIAGTKAGLYRWAEVISGRLSNHVLTVSEEIAKHLVDEDVALARKVEVLHLGAGATPTPSKEAAEVRREVEAGEGTSLIVTASRLAPQKALHVMFAALRELDRNTVLAILGEGPLQRELMETVRRMGIEDRVRFLGFRDDVAAYIAAADDFALSSIWEGVPLAAMEAIQLGVPVVGTAVGGMPELVRDGWSGYLVPPNDPPALAAALKEVLNDPLLVERFTFRAKEHLEKHFSTAAMLQRLTEIYRERAGA